MSRSARARRPGWTRRLAELKPHRCEAARPWSPMCSTPARADRVMDVSIANGAAADPRQQRRRRRPLGQGERRGHRPAVWSEVYEKNAMAAVRFTRRALPAMRRGKWGRVVTITSIYGGKEGVGRPWFTMAKAAETGLMKSLSAMSLPGARRHHLQFRGAGRHLDSRAPASRTNRRRDPAGFQRRSTQSIRWDAWERRKRSRPSWPFCARPRPAW